MQKNRYRNNHSYHSEKTAAKSATVKGNVKKKNKSRWKSKNSASKNQNVIAFTSTPGLPVTHPCYNCPIARIYGNKLFCFTPHCMRQVFENCGKSRNQESTI